MRTWIPLLLSVLAVGCNKKNPGPDPLADVLGFCEEWGKRACNDTVVMNCSAAKTDDCITAQQAFCQTLITDESKYSEAGAGACLDAVQQAYSDAVLTASERDTVRKLGTPCDAILSGHGEAGDTCSQASDCNRAEGFTCVQKTLGAAGTCQKPKTIGGGDSCSATGDVCAAGYYCSADEHCISGNAAGDSCSATQPCESDSQCLTADGQPLGSSDGGGVATCQARKATGGACKTDDDCVSQICSGATASASGVCSQTIILSPTDPVCTDLR